MSNTIITFLIVIGTIAIIVLDIIYKPKFDAWADKWRAEHKAKIDKIKADGKERCAKIQAQIDVLRVKRGA